MYRNLFGDFFHYNLVPFGSRLKLTDRIKEEIPNFDYSTYFNQLKFHKGEIMKFHTTQEQYQSRRAGSLIRSVVLYGFDLDKLVDLGDVTSDEIKKLREVKLSEVGGARKFYEDKELVYILPSKGKKSQLYVPMEDDSAFRRRSLMLGRLIDETNTIKPHEVFELYIPSNSGYILSFDTVPPTQRRI